MHIAATDGFRGWPELEYVRYGGTDDWPGLVDTVVATAESVTDEQFHDVLLEVLALL